MKFTRIEREEELFELWKSLPVPGCRLRGIGDKRIVLITQGTLNNGAGPDFLDAILLIDGDLRVGAVEMHLREADWFAHGHDRDPAYNSVVLHVLAEELAPDRQRLPMPTVSAKRLIEGAAAGRTERTTADVSDESCEGPSVDLLVEYSWGRLLRRVTEILRDEHETSTEGRIERAFLCRLLDSLGYSRNREPMKRVAEQILSMRSRYRGIGFDATASMIFAGAGVPTERLAIVGRSFMSDERLAAVLPASDWRAKGLRWDYTGRPANWPERRLWAGAKLTFDFFQGGLLNDLLGGIRRKVGYASMVQPLIVRLGEETILGRPRAKEIVVNVLCPVALAAGIMRTDIDLIEGACLTYRNAPPLASNRIVREVERRFGDGRLNGAFFQQGAIEYYQRVLSPDRTGYSMIAEPGKTGMRDER